MIVPEDNMNYLKSNDFILIFALLQHEICQHLAAKPLITGSITAIVDYCNRLFK